MEQFLYRLKLREDLIDDANWTETDNKIVELHFLRLKKDVEEKKVILAGRTVNPDSSQFGIVIFYAESDQEAEQYMNEDPAVKNGVMSATLYPFRVTLLASKQEI